MTREALRIFVGYDERESIAYHVLCHSILSRASIPVAFIPLRQDALRKEGIYTRERTALESTAFSFTRFLVPYLSGYWGTSVFCDCDMLMRVDIAELIAECGRKAVKCLTEGKPEPSLYCCQHDYQPSETVKFLGNVQTVYPRKNWSSFMVFKNQKCAALTPEYVNRATGLELHRFQWLRDEEICGLDLGWNWLVGEYQPNPEAKVLHWTLGGPWFPEYANADHAAEWWEERYRMIGGAEAPAYIGTNILDDNA
jgi:hypothetical protein